MNIQAIVKELLDRGYSEAKIAKAISDEGYSVSQPTIHRIAKGDTKNCAYETGRRLIELHKRVLEEQEAA